MTALEIFFRENEIFLYQISLSVYTATLTTLITINPKILHERKAKAGKRDVSISSIIPRNDNWNNKVIEVNKYLKDLCELNDIPFISNTTINPKKHWNNSRLDLNPKGSNKLCDNFVRYLKGLTSWETAKRN